MSEYAIIHVRDNLGDSWPVVERVPGGWQSGAHHYPDGRVLEVEPLVVVPPDDEGWWMERDTAIQLQAQVQVLRELGTYWLECSKQPNANMPTLMWASFAVRVKADELEAGK